MSKKSLLFGAIASVLSINAYATSATVTSKDYVDNKFQEKIPVNAVTITTKDGTVNVPNALVAYPNDTPGEIGEIGVVDAELIDIPAVVRSIGGNDNTPLDEIIELDDLGWFEGLIPTAEIISWAAVNSLDQKQTKKTCAGWPDGTTVPDPTHTDANCWLWNLPD